MFLKRIPSKAHALLMTIVLSLAFAARAFAADIGLHEDVRLTPPVGEGILPGSGLFQPGFKEGLLFSKVIPFAITYAIGLAVALAVIALIIGGYRFITAYGNTERMDAAKKTITYGILGLIVAITAYGIVFIITQITFV